MIRREKLQAIILSRKKLGEADRVVTLFTRRHGVLRAVAKGVRKIPSRRGGYLEPLTHALCIISGPRWQPYLAAVEQLTAYEALHGHPSALEGAVVLARAILGVCEEGEAYESIFDGFHQALEILPQLSAAQRSVVESALLLHILAAGGLRPYLAACQVCGQTRPQEAIVLDGHEGGWRCLACHDSFVGTEASLPPRLLAAARWLASNPAQALRLAVEPLEGEQLVVSLRRYIGQVIGEPIYSSVRTYGHA